MFSEELEPKTEKKGHQKIRVLGSQPMWQLKLTKDWQKGQEIKIMIVFQKMGQIVVVMESARAGSRCEQSFWTVCWDTALGSGGGVSRRCSNSGQLEGPRWLEISVSALPQVLYKCHPLCMPWHDDAWQVLAEVSPRILVTEKENRERIRRNDQLS